MLLANQAHRHDATGGDCDRGTKKAFQHEDAFGVMPQRPVPEIGGNHLAFIDYMDST